MKFQKFYIYFCSFSWLAWLFSILTIDVWGYTTHSNIVFILSIIPYFLSLTPTYTVFSIVALVKSIKAKKKPYIIFNIVSMITTLILGFLNIVYCAVYYSGGAWWYLKVSEIHSAFAMYKNARNSLFWPHWLQWGKPLKTLVFMRVSIGLSYNNVFLNTAYNSCCFHVYISPHFTNCVVSICKQRLIIPCVFFSFQIIKAAFTGKMNE